jgi:hypothetical protein
MNIGELFVDLGVKGAQGTVGAVMGVKNAMTGTATASLEAKAAILGAMYAFQRMMSESGALGTKMTNFNNLLGMSVKTLQQYQFAARQVGVSNQSVENTFKNLQSAMTKTLLGKGAPEGLARVAAVVGDMTAQDLKKFSEQPELLLQKLQEYAQREVSPTIRNEVLRSFGIDDDMIAAMSRNAFRPDVLQRAPLYSDKEVDSLHKADVAWSNLGNKIQMSFGKFNAKHGGEIVEELTKITDKVIKLAEALMKFSDSVGLFERIGEIIKGWEMIFTGLTEAVDKLMLLGSEEGRQQLKDEAAGFLTEEVPNLYKFAMDELFGEKPDPEQTVEQAIDARKSPETLAIEKELKELNDTLKSTGKVDSQRVLQLRDALKESREDDRRAGVDMKGNIKPRMTESTEWLKMHLERLKAKKPEVGSKEFERMGEISKELNLRKQSKKDGVSVEQPAINTVVSPSPTAAAVQKAPMPTISSSATQNTTSQNLTVNQNLNFQHEGKEAKQVSDASKQGVSQAYRQLSAQGQGS